mmetsp:Transcript_57429/g.170905  ORF Transcript_57429/g.170905 Transcript_57429/m.170905 type:complete len:212 (-) Transcript_57429:583-1218(-)
MADSSSETVRSRAFFLSSARSNCVPQYSFLCSSSTCSFLSASTISSIIEMTFSKPPCWRAFLPLSANTNRSNSVLCWCLGDFRAVRRAAMAFERRADAVNSTCTKLAELGSVFLNSSSASSSLRTLIVSASATSSSALVLERSSHSLSFLAQVASRFARKFLSSASAAWVSSRSPFICMMLTPSSPTCIDLVSMDFVSAPTSLVLAAIRPS